ncbi:DUF4421 domain-containing protein [Zhouia spongiae]|uniref:DUF4421 domain-containing protein n=1 Tax=Zhouia spongiae TaxID=2202721 RepID=A0ABY3YK22_9FLAO|nr:DUF4421 family protein [Zhouia spongiae]UNY98172.1 DUF4421 domain-containing protein [Zhouia spongiae]
MNKLLLHSIVLLSLSPLFGQDTETKQDTFPVISYYDKIMFKANVDTRADSYFSKRSTPNQEELGIMNNNSLRTFFILNYRFLSVSFGFSPKFLPGNDDDDLKGASSFNDLKFRLFFGKWIQELHYSKVSGFYVTNTDDFLPGWQEGVDPYIQLPGLSITSWGGTTGYVMNPEYSLKSIYFQTEWQKKSSGSLIPSVSYYYDHYAVRGKEFTNISSVENIFTLSAAMSYYYTWVIHNRWYIAPYATTLTGVKFSNYKPDRSNNLYTEKNTYFSMAIEGGLQIGYNAPRFFLGTAFNLNSNWYTSGSKNNRLINDKIYGLVYIGYRFNAPEFIKKTFNKVHDKTGI